MLYENKPMTAEEFIKSLDEAIADFSDNSEPDLPY